MEVAEFYDKHSEEIKEVLSLCEKEVDYCYLLGFRDNDYENKPSKEVIRKWKSLKKKAKKEKYDPVVLVNIIVSFIETMIDLEKETNKELVEDEDEE